VTEEGLLSYLEEMFSLKSKRIVITGGAGGIPAELAIGLAKAGAALCLWGRGPNHPMMEEAARSIREAARAASGKIEALTIDTGDVAACERAIAETEDLIGAPNILVNGVGGNRGNPLSWRWTRRSSWR
jgi:NAD(P)-dependent dehydrogenase (short-subunit alcohol dehydrogenase family)